MNNQLLYWGFDPTGTALGGVNSASAPDGFGGGPDFANPREFAEENGLAFLADTRERYSMVENLRGALWDPRGDAALSAELGDYRTGYIDPDAAIKDFEGEVSAVLQAGEPTPGRVTQRTNVNTVAIGDSETTGLSPENAANLAQVLSQYEPGVVETMYLPRQAGLPQVADDTGFVSPGGAGPQTFRDQVLQGMSGPDMIDVLDRVRADQPWAVQQVDQNGTVNKYAPGTGPYDAPGATRPGGIGGARRGTGVQSPYGSAQRLATRTKRSGMAGIGQVEEESKLNFGHVAGFIGLSLLGVVGVSMLMKGAG